MTLSGTVTEPKFSDLMLEGAGLTDQLFYILIAPPSDNHPRPRACAVGAACYAADEWLRQFRLETGRRFGDGGEASFRAETVFTSLIDKYSLNTLVELRRVDFPQLFSDLEQHYDLWPGEELIRLNLAHDLIFKLNDGLHYSVPQIAAIVRQLGY
jgi:hypothetical protein